MQARFLFSGDKEFTQAGKIIKYACDFDHYKKTLIITSNNAHIQKTFGLWNDYLFGPKETSEQAGDESETDKMLKAIDNMGTDNEEPVTSATGPRQAAPTAPAAGSRQPAPIPTPTPTLPLTALTAAADSAPGLIPDKGSKAPAVGDPVAEDNNRKRGKSTRAGARGGRARGRNAAGRGRGRGGKRVTTEDIVTEDVVTEEEDAPAKPTTRCLTRQGASEQVISITCGGSDEESE